MLIAAVQDEAFERIAALLGASLSRALEQAPLDGVYLDLHGAAMAESFPDAEGELLRRVRAIVGADLPLTISLDPHANSHRADGRAGGRGGAISHLPARRHEGRRRAGHAPAAAAHRARDAVGARVPAARFLGPDHQPMHHVGVEPAACQILALKSSVHFRADFGPIAERIIVAVAPGPVVADSSTLPFRNVRPGVRMRPGER